MQLLALTQLVEVPFWIGLVSLWWTAALTLFLPLTLLLKYSKYFRDMWFPFMFTKVLSFWDNHHIPLRKRQFELLKDKLPNRDVSKPLKILEIGIGSGPNLAFYPPNSRLTALDMNVNFEKYFKENCQKYPHITYERTVIGVAENMKGIEDNSFDVVVSSYVLCSVNVPKDALKEIKRVLKPGGKYVFLEHVAYPKHDWGYTLQNFVQPLWWIFFDHCCLLRDSGSAIEKAEFSDVSYDTVYPNFMNILVRAQIVGVATK